MNQPNNRLIHRLTTIVIGLIVVSAVAVSYSLSQVTSKTTTELSISTVTITGPTYVQVQTMTTTSTIYQTLACTLPSSNATVSYTTNCDVGMTLGLSANSIISVGSNQTVNISLINPIAQLRTVNYTDYPNLPSGFPSLNQGFARADYILPAFSSCFLPSDYAPEFVLLLNSSGYAMQVNDINGTNTVCSTSNPSSQSYQFGASQIITETFSIGGYWTSPDTSEPWINATYHQLTPGNYTVVAFNPWDELLKFNFAVETMP